MVANRVAVLNLDGAYYISYFDKFFKDPPIQLVKYDKSFVKEPTDSWWAEPRDSACVDLVKWKEDVKYLGVVRTCVFVCRFN
jgi:hypothetical protein